MFYLLVGLTIPSLRAGKHPVPLDPKVDAARCVECHEDKTKGKAVHSAMAGGCLSCHEVRVNRDVTRVKLTAATDLALCLSCHADKKASDIKGKIHNPAVRQCLECRNTHAAENKNQLVKARPAEPRTRTSACPATASARAFPREAAGTRRSTWVARHATPLTRWVTERNSNSQIT